LNAIVVKYFRENRQRGVNFARRRPDKKNDAAHVEQKNDATVRQLFGYERLDHPGLFIPMNEIYRVWWHPLKNFFTPTLKLINKTRIGGRIKKTYDKPRTPLERLLESDELHPKVRIMLKDK
jgi:hypothetical protein